jgi:hypothetical protein
VPTGGVTAPGGGGSTGKATTIISGTTWTQTGGQATQTPSAGTATGGLGYGGTTIARGGTIVGQGQTITLTAGQSVQTLQIGGQTITEYLTQGTGWTSTYLVHGSSLLGGPGANGWTSTYAYTQSKQTPSPGSSSGFAKTTKTPKGYTTTKPTGTATQSSFTTAYTCACSP